MRHDPSQSEPVLLGGQNRSGTTLLSVLLDSHRDLVVGPEIDFLFPPNLGSHVLEACSLLQAGDPLVLGPGTDTEDPYWYDGAHFVKQCERFGVATAQVARLVRQAMTETGSDLSAFEDRCYLVGLLGDQRRAETGTQRWGLKLQREIRRVDEFAAYWPKARFLHIIRDGRDLAASHLRSVPWGFNDIREAAEGWLSVVEPPAALAPPEMYLEIRYEDLVRTPREVLGSVTDFLDLKWDESVLRHWEHPHSLFETPWAHPAAEAAAKPLSRTSVGRYHMDLTSDEVHEFEEIAGHHLTRFGYQLSSDRSSS